MKKADRTDNVASPDFIKKDEVSNEFESIMSDEISRRSKSLLATTSFNPSSLIECPRKLSYQLMEVKSENSLDYITLINDSFVKKRWVDHFKKFKGIRLVQENITAADCHYNILGILDAVIQIHDVTLATQIFMIKSEDFIEVKKSGAFKKHVVEVLVYMWLTEILDGLLIYENRDTHEYLSFHITPFAPIITAVQKKCLLLMENKIQGKIPERPYKTKSDECKRCEHLKLCWD